MLLCDWQLAEVELRAGFSLVGLGDAREPHSKYLQHVLSNAWQSVAVGFRRAHVPTACSRCFALLCAPESALRQLRV